MRGLAELTKLAEAVKNASTEEERQSLIQRAAAILPKGYAGEMYKNGLAAKARVDGPLGYAAFYELMHGFPPPEHIMREIETIYKAHGEGVGSVVFAWRGSWKSVSISVTFIAYRIGLEPWKTNVVVGANDDSAEKVTKAVAALIEHHPEWKRVFPNVIPDTGRWSVEGFWVLDNSVSREEWTKKQSGVIDPTLVGGGYKSSRLIGKHPSGVLDIDDIHDRDNSASEKERLVVVDILVKTILKTVIKEKDKMTTWLVAVGTPWAEDDAYYTMKNTGQYEFISIPAMIRAKEGQGVYIDGVNRDGTVFEDIMGWWNLTFPKHFGINTVIKERADGKVSFWQMIMLDLATAETGKLRYYTTSVTDEMWSWPMIGGADPTNTFKEGSGSHFALAYLAKNPNGGAVILDGVLERCSQLKAENHILAAQSRFPNWQGTYVENVGGGAGFIQTLRRNASIRVFESGLKGITDAKIKNKKDRVLNDMAKWFENGKVRVSDADTPFLNAVRRLFDKFEDLDPYTDYSFDAIDAVYHAMKNMPDVLFDDVKLFAPRKKSYSPLSGLNSHRGYGA